MSFARASCHSHVHKSLDAIQRALQNLSDLEADNRRNWGYVRDQLARAQSMIDKARVIARDQEKLHRISNGDTDRLP